MMSNSVPECEKDNLTGCVSFYTQWIDICVCIRFVGPILFDCYWSKRIVLKLFGVYAGITIIFNRPFTSPEP